MPNGDNLPAMLTLSTDSLPEDDTLVTREDIDVQSSINQYNQVQSDLAKDSEKARAEDPNFDAEKGQAEEFDLKEYFENSARSATENGSKLKRMGVSVKNLTVVGQGAEVSILNDLTSPFIYLAGLLNPLRWIKREEVPTFDILHDVNAFCEDGKMLLVLGRPGAGCSTLLRVIANQRAGYVSVDGDVTYGGIPADDFGRYLGEAIYTAEEDAHFPQLTVRQTLNFALKTKTPGNRLPEESRKTFRAKTFDLLLSMFGMQKQVDTFVGNEWLRGLSGGERKRMSIIEAMTVSPAICCWDCSTRGLDAASALDYAKSIRIMTDTLKKTTVASFYQASENIYDLFDDVLVLEKGRVIYFGPTKDAKQYFVDLGFDCEPRKSTPDFLTGVTNFQERKIREGFQDKAPSTSFEFEDAWKKSKGYSDAMERQQRFEKSVETDQPSKDFREEIKDQKASGARKKSKYTVGFFDQVLALTIRQLQLIWMDKFGLVTRYFSVLAQSLIYGSVFYQLSLNVSGGFSRGGALFSALLFNAFTSQAELPMSFFGRRTLQKHKSYAMYHPSAYHLAQVAADIPVVLIQVFLFSIICYFMFGLATTAGQFFVFVFVLVISSLCMTNLFRVFGNTTPSLYVAQQFMTAILILMICYSGYLIPRPKMHPWLGWIYWVNPFAYAFQALFANEMRNLTFQCTGPEGVIPYGPGIYDNPANQVCALPGSQPGSLVVAGSNYLKVAYEFDVDRQALYAIVVFLFWVLFTIMNMIAMEFLEFTNGGYAHKVYKRGKAPKKNTNEGEKEAQRKLQAATESMNTTLQLRGGVFMWKDVRYTVPVKGGDRLLLEDVEGWIKPGQMTALMGSSGAGKTTLLDVLAKRKTMGKISGEISLNGQPLKIDFERITGYVEQMDVHNPGCTVREALQFSAKLRQEKSVPFKEKMEYVEKILEMMEMKHMGDALIGDLESGVGISVEERKRLTIGMELVAMPHILFLDEPTSGLDAQSSYNIVKFVRKLADAGMPLVCTIHQPSSVLFEHFDRLLLLAKGGKTVYFGDIGDHSSVLTNYFVRNGARPCTEQENPAEYILEAIGAGVHGKTDKDWPALWKSSKECQEVNSELDRMMSDATLHKANESGEEPREFATGSGYQLWQVYKRMNLVYWRDPFYNVGRLAQAVMIGLINGFSYWNLQNSTSDLQSRILCLFQSVVLGLMLIFGAMPQFFLQREYFRRDYASKFYSWFPFAISIVIVELPYLIVAGTLAMVCSYWTAGLDSTAGNGFYFWITYVLFLFYCVSFGQAIAAICLNIFQAMLLLPLLVVFLFLFCGVLQPPSQLPYFWRSWMYPLDPFHYFLEGMVVDILNETKVVCTQSDYFIVQPPTGTTCGTYFAPYLTQAPGYIGNPDATADCQYCQFSKGSDFFETIPWSYDHRWRNFGIFAAFWIFNIGLVVLFVFLMRKPRR
eukprot:TRINITY_DN227_c0_g1_i1.p1 TRINITY_DN227_c0_g1~~TRINITY_DN227_c0_g1_i1.p1  ORF type:complete len:1474 (-),score=463.74 TRINITY_DN227_c0_g1_i1:47-4363(-)